MREPRVLGEATEQRIQHCRRLPLPAERRVGRRRGRDERERIVDGHFGIVGEIAIDARQGVRVRLQPAAVRPRLVVTIEGAAGCEKAPLPRRGCAERERPLRRDRALPQVVTRRAAYERVPPEVQRQSPVRERTGGVGCHDVAERPTAFLPPEGDRKSTRLNSSHSQISYAVFCLKKKKKKI